MFIIKYKKIFLSIGLFLLVSSGIFTIVQGFSLGIDFTGGSLLEVSYGNGRPEISDLEERVSTLAIGSILLQPVNEAELIVRTKDLVEEEKTALFQALDVDGSLEEISFTSVGPSIGKELQTKATIAIVVVSIVMILFIAYTFRAVAKPVSSWNYGLVAIATLVHDVVVTTGIYVLFGLLFGAEIDALFVVAILTILGLSINDTIVIFDRIRENLKISNEKDDQTPFSKIVGKSLEQSFTRSLNTSVSVIIVLVALVIWGPESTRMFSITLALGMFFGTYSSLFLASPLLVQIYEWQKRK